MESRGEKRKRQEQITQNDSSWPQFLLIASKDAALPITKLSPFVIEKALTGLAGSPKNVKKLKSGQLLVECEKKAHSENLLKSKHMAGIEIEIKPHPYLNSSRGIIKFRDLKFCSGQENLLELKPQGVIAIYRFKKKVKK